MNKLRGNLRAFVLLIFALAAVSFLLLFLYKNYFIFAKYVEHGVVVSKQDAEENFKYEIWIDGKQYYFTAADKNLNINTGVINFKYRNGYIVKFMGYVEPVNEKIMSKSPRTIELELSGVNKLSKNPNIYSISGGSTKNGSIDSILVGAKNIYVYKDRNGRIKTIIAKGEIIPDTIRVGIKNTLFKSLEHDKIIVSSKGEIKVEDKKSREIINVPSGNLITLTPDSHGILVQCGSETKTLKNRVYVEPMDKTLPTSIESIKRGYGIPSYKGFFEITNYQGRLRLINEVKVEDYLRRVVPSEMPSSFGLEALKAQAVAARTYALSDMYSSRFAEEGFHVDDSTMSQVYNNCSENGLTTKAVNSTAGLVMKYDGAFVDAKYYSTSHGYGAMSGDIWSSDGKFPGDNKPYFAADSYLLSEKKYNLSSESEAAAFFKDWSLRSYDSNSPYFRWKVTFSKDELKNTIEKNLMSVYKQQQDYILTLINGAFMSKPIPANCLGDLKDIKVTRRGHGGNIMELLVYGTNGIYKIVKELNVRYVIRPRKSDTGSPKDIIIKRLNGSDLVNNSMLPSAFMVFDITRDSSDNIKDIIFYGGGYGHGVGMSQYGAGYLSSRGYSFDRILGTYYKNISIEKLY